jgi:hypothetical protein
MEGDAILLNLSTGVYYCIGGSGGSIWSFLTRGQNLKQIIDSVTEHYVVEHGRARADIEKLISQLLQENIIAFADKEFKKNIDPLPPHGTGRTYETPELRTFRDMSDLLALDPPMPELPDIPWRESDEPSSDMGRK